MKKYSNEERFECLNRYVNKLSITNNTAFTTLTQHFHFTTFEEIADTILHYESFNKSIPEPEIPETTKKVKTLRLYFFECTYTKRYKRFEFLKDSKFGYGETWGDEL